MPKVWPHQIKKCLFFSEFRGPGSLILRCQAPKKKIEKGKVRWGNSQAFFTDLGPAAFLHIHRSHWRPKITDSCESMIPKKHRNFKKKSLNSVRLRSRIVWLKIEEYLIYSMISWDLAVPENNEKRVCPWEKIRKSWNFRFCLFFDGHAFCLI